MESFFLTGPAEEEMSYICPDISFGKVAFDGLASGGDEIAIIDAFTNESLTYLEIRKQCIAVAIALKKMGIGKNDVVAIISENCMTYPIPIIASTFIGAIPNPLNPAYTTRELKHATDITKPKAIFCSEFNIKSVLTVKNEVDYIHKVFGFGFDSDGVIDLNELIKLGSPDFENFVPISVNTREQVAAVLCSSGTTGLPKGVMISHRNMTMAATYINEPKFLNIRDGEVTIGLLPFFHAFGLLVSIASLTYHMKLVLMAKFKPDMFLKAIQEHKVTKLFIAPPLAVFLAKSPMVDNYDLSSITDVICAAAPLGIEVQNILEHKLNVVVRQGYGMTETSGCISVSPTNCVNKVGSAGKLVYGVTMKINDIETNKKLGVGEIGEICVKGEMNMRGYFGNEKATKEMYDEEGFLHTGDIGYYDEDGFIFIVDRLKELIKYKGFQVAPAELEDILTSHNEITDAGVIGVPDERAGEGPFAFVVKKPGSTLSENDVKEFVAKHVSIQKQLHGGVKFIDAIPKSSTGKILRKHLREILSNNRV